MITATGMVVETTHHGMTLDGNGRRGVVLTDTATAGLRSHYRARDNSAANDTIAGLHRGEVVTLELTAHGTVLRVNRAEQWAPAESHAMGATARHLMRDHGHGWQFSDRDDEILTRENCGACVLEPRGADLNDRGHVGPNYAGWARIYVQAHAVIPLQWVPAFLDELNDREPIAPGDLTPYARALRRDLATFGAHLQGVTL